MTLIDGKTDWEETPLDEILIDVHLRSGVTTFPLPFLIDLIYPFIKQRMDRELSVSLQSTVAIDGKTIAKLVSPFIDGRP